MTPALQEFATHLASLGIKANMTFSASPLDSLTIPARHDEVGTVTVFDESEELTVEIGRLHHSHFTLPGDAAKFVANLIADRICVTVDFLGDRCIGSSTISLDNEGTSPQCLRDTAIGLKGGNIRSERYLWSGPVR